VETLVTRFYMEVENVESKPLLDLPGIEFMGSNVVALKPRQTIRLLECSGSPSLHCHGIYRGQPTQQSFVPLRPTPFCSIAISAKPRSFPFRRRLAVEHEESVILFHRPG
jgi:hypothetical protein